MPFRSIGIEILLGESPGKMIDQPTPSIDFIRIKWQNAVKLGASEGPYGGFPRSIDRAL